MKAHHYLAREIGGGIVSAIAIGLISGVLFVAFVSQFADRLP